MDSNTFFDLWKHIRNGFDVIFENHDNSWMTRSRLIDSRFLVLFILRLVIPKDERGYSCTLTDIFNHFLNFGIQNVPKKLAPSSVCEARQKLHPCIFQELNNCVLDAKRKFVTPTLWRGHRLYGIDGSKFNLPRELINSGYTTPGSHSHYPQALVSAVYDLLTGIPHDYEIAKHHNERQCAINHLERIFLKGDVIVYDRGYFSFELLQEHIKRDIHAIFRMPRNLHYADITQFWESDKTDEIIVLYPPTRIVEAAKQKKSKVAPITVRLVKYIINDVTYVLCVTLIDKVKYPAEIFPNVYHERWGFEEMLKVSKVITGVEDFHSKTEQGIKQELYAHFLLITLTKIIETQSHYEVKQEKILKQPPKRRLRHLKDLNKQSKEMKSSNEGAFKMNRKNCFINVASILENLFWWDLEVFLETVLTNVIEVLKRTYQKVRPNRSYPRKSKRPINKWNNSTCKQFKIKMLC